MSNDTLMLVCMIAIIVLALIMPIIFGFKIDLSDYINDIEHQMTQADKQLASRLDKLSDKKRQKFLQQDETKKLIKEFSKQSCELSDKLNVLNDRYKHIKM